MIKERAENVLKAYVAANFQGSGAPLADLALYAGHAAGTILESDTGEGYAIVECEDQGGPLVSVGIPTLRVRWIIRAPASDAGQLSLEAWSQEIVNIFSLDRLAVFKAWINETQSAENIALNVLRYITSASGRVKDRGQLGAEIIFDGEWYLPSDD